MIEVSGRPQLVAHDLDELLLPLLERLLLGDVAEHDRHAGEAPAGVRHRRHDGGQGAAREADLLATRGPGAP